MLLLLFSPWKLIVFYFLLTHWIVLADHVKRVWFVKLHSFKNLKLIQDNEMYPDVCVGMIVLSLQVKYFCLFLFFFLILLIAKEADFGRSRKCKRALQCAETSHVNRLCAENAYTYSLTA